MARTAVRLTFTGNALNDPVIYQIGKDYRGVTNIRRADRAEDSGWVELDLDGEPGEIDGALEYCKGRGITVEKLPH